MLQSLYCESREKNIQNYFLVNDKGDSVKLERGKTFFWAELNSPTKHIQYGFCIEDFDNDYYQFNTCINEIINDLFEDGFYNLF